MWREGSNGEDTTWEELQAGGGGELGWDGMVSRIDFKLVVGGRMLMDQCENARIEALSHLHNACSAMDLSQCSRTGPIPLI